MLRLLPKGETTDARHNYGIWKESVRLIEKTAQMLCEHYNLQPGEPLPRIAFSPYHNRSHRFEGLPVPYIFQYNRTHVTDASINGCLRFLLHGMVFQTREDAPVVIRPHLLRHAFATFAVNIEGLPIDLVAKWLQQKNLEVTGYYSEMPEYMQVEQHASFLERLGYIFRADNTERTKRYFREAQGLPRVHIHVRRLGSFSEQFALLFRDYVRVHPGIASHYAQLKIELAQQYARVEDRHAYTETKSSFIWKVIAQADEWAQQIGWIPGSSDA